MNSGICNHPRFSCCSRHAFIAKVVFDHEALQLTLDDVGLGTFRANDEDGAAVAVPEENIAYPGTAAHEAGEDGFSEVDVVVIDDERKVFADFFAPEAGEVMKVAVIEEVEAARREVGDATTDFIRSGIIAEASGTGQRGEIEDARLQRSNPRGRGDAGARRPRGCWATGDDGRRTQRALGSDGRRARRGRRRERCFAAARRTALLL